MNTIYIIPIEPIDQRYTKQWYDNIPKIIEKRVRVESLAYNIVTIDGEDFSPEQRTEGAFLDFGATNVYKSTQAAEVSRMFSNGIIKDGDKFLITDAWNFIITPIKYMSELLGINVEIHSIWHAGAYDPSDILGYTMSKPWPWLQEQAWFMSSDYNYFATDSHKDMFVKNLDIPEKYQDRAIRSGQPHELIIEPLMLRQSTPKTNTVMWPHRYNDDKQPFIAEALGDKFDMCITQKMNLDKDAYYDKMATSKIVFSCALHENLGISVMEAVLTGAIPIVPDRCSYKEMYLPEFKYPTQWTENEELFNFHRKDLESFIQDKLNNYESLLPLVAKQQQILMNNYLNSSVMIDRILEL